MKNLVVSSLLCLCIVFQSHGMRRKLNIKLIKKAFTQKPIFFNGNKPSSSRPFLKFYSTSSVEKNMFKLFKSNLLKNSIKDSDPAKLMQGESVLNYTTSLMDQVEDYARKHKQDLNQYAKCEAYHKLMDLTHKYDLSAYFVSHYVASLLKHYDSNKDAEIVCRYLILLALRLPRKHKVVTKVVIRLNYNELLANHGLDEIFNEANIMYVPEDGCY